MKSKELPQGTLLSQVAGCPAQLVEQLQRFSITTAEAFLGWLATQPREAAASALRTSQEALDQAVRSGRAAASKEFLRELDVSAEISKWMRGMKRTRKLHRHPRPLVAPMRKLLPRIPSWLLYCMFNLHEQAYATRRLSDWKNVPMTKLGLRARLVVLGFAGNHGVPSDEMTGLRK